MLEPIRRGKILHGNCRTHRMTGGRGSLRVYPATSELAVASFDGRMKVTYQDTGSEGDIHCTAG